MRRSLPFLMICILATGGCRSQHTETDGVTAPSDGWTETEEIPTEVWKAAQRHSREQSAKPWLYEGVSPRAFLGVSGNYRICWIKRDPLRGTYWWYLYEFKADGSLISATSSSIPSRLQEPDPRKIPRWQYRCFESGRRD
jgi:hypothetical protein